ITPQKKQGRSLIQVRIRPTRYRLAANSHGDGENDSVNLIWPTLITYLATTWVNQLPHPGRSEALRRP
ncbi:MAG: hypothetical protein WAK48_18815, partial [Candidatus Acidiferrum sp.]